MKRFLPFKSMQILIYYGVQSSLGGFMLQKPLLITAFLLAALISAAYADDGHQVVTTFKTSYSGTSGGYPGLGQTGLDGSFPSQSAEGQSSDSLMMYQEFYDMGQGTESTAGPAQFDIYGAEPTYLIINGQSKPYNSYYMPSNSFWIQGRTSWTQYIKCPMNARFKMLAYSQGGPAKVVETYPNGYQMVNQYVFYNGYTQLVFVADAVGRHTITFYCNGQPSNSVVVDVVPYSSPYVSGGVPSTGKTSSTFVSINTGNVGQGIRPSPATACSIIGVWRFGNNNIYVNSDGSLIARDDQGNTFDSGSWQLIDASQKLYTFTWQSGWSHRFTLSPNCSNLDGDSSDGKHTSGTKMASGYSGNHGSPGNGQIMIDSQQTGFNPDPNDQSWEGSRGGDNSGGTTYIDSYREGFYPAGSAQGEGI